MIEQPIKIKPDGNGFTLIRFQENGPWKREFLRGGIVFPRYDIRENRYSGCIAVCGSSLSGEATLYRIARFEKYDFQLAELFRSVYRDFGVDRYYYRADGSGDEDARKFEIQSGLRKRRNADSVYPVLIPLKFCNAPRLSRAALRRSSQKMRISFSDRLLRRPILSYAAEALNHLSYS